MFIIPCSQKVNIGRAAFLGKLVKIVVAIAVVVVVVVVETTFQPSPTPTPPQPQPNPNPILTPVLYQNCKKMYICAFWYLSKKTRAEKS